MRDYNDDLRDYRDEDEGIGQGGNNDTPFTSGEGKGGSYQDAGDVVAADTGISGAGQESGGESGDDKLGPQGTSTTPREGLPGSNGNVRSTPPGGSVPRPAQGAVSNINRGESGPQGGGAGSPGVVPFQPLPSIGQPGRSGSRLFGALGGLQGGGLGAPRSVANIGGPEQSSIGQLIAMLQRKRGLF